MPQGSWFRGPDLKLHATRSEAHGLCIDIVDGRSEISARIR
jgi:hypothetical protein